VRRFAKFAGVTVAVVLVLAFGLTLVMKDAQVARAVWMSAAFAVAVQLAAFGLTRATQPANVIAGWGAGMIIRVAALAVYALFVVKSLGLPMGPALLSLAAFFFVTTLIEPVFLKP
jgi:hypothetical protein